MNHKIGFVFLILFVLNCAPRTAVSPKPEPLDVVVTTSDEVIECRILKRDSTRIVIKGKYDQFSYPLDLTGVKEIHYGDGRIEHFFQGESTPPESLEHRQFQAWKTEKSAGSANRQFFGGMGLILGGAVSWRLFGVLGPFSWITPYGLLSALPIIVGTTMGYGYGKRKDLEEARKKVRNAPAPDSLKGNPPQKAPQ
jgi:hypothetical protein